MKKVIFISPEGKEYECTGWAMHFKSGWEWYALGEQRPEDLAEGIHFGLVHGFETEFGYFSENELAENGIKLLTSYKDLNGIMPPMGWTRKA